MPFIYATLMILAACLIAGLVANVVEPRRIRHAVFIDDLHRWYVCKEFLTFGDAIKICIFGVFLLLVLYAGPLLMTYFPQANVLHYRQQQLWIIPTPIMVNHHWATTVSYYVLMVPLSFILLNTVTKGMFKHSPRAYDLAGAIEANQTLSKIMIEKTPEGKFYRFKLDQISPHHVIMYHRAGIEFRELRTEKERLANAGNLDIFWMHEVKHGEIHFKVTPAQLLEQENGFVQRADGSLVNLRYRDNDGERYMYFMEINDTIKIGGGNDPRDRLSACETFVPLPNILAYAPESVLTETEARRLFKQYKITEVNGKRIKGDELFSRNPKILEFIEDGLESGKFKRFEE